MTFHSFFHLLSNQISAITNQILGITTDVSTIESDISDINSDIVDINSDISDITSDISDLTTLITTLEGIWHTREETFIDGPAVDQIWLFKVPNGHSVKAIRIRSSGVPAAGTINAQRDNNSSLTSLLSGGTAINASTVTPANAELNVTLHTTISNLVLTDTSWVKVTVSNLALPTPATDSLYVAILTGVV